MHPYSPRNNVFPIQPNVLDVFRGKYFLPILKEEVIRKKNKLPFQKRGSLEREK
jgi:hypothetical protein